MVFICIDVETANESAASICQLGIALFLDDGHAAQFDMECYVNPETYFVPELAWIHGITPETVLGAPNFPQIHAAITTALNGRVVLSHSSFDRVSISQACAKYKLPEPECLWLDTLRVAKRAWPERAGSGGHGLAAMAKHCHLPLHHHSALSDAVCCGEIFLQACATNGYQLDEWLVRAAQPITLPLPNRLEGNPDGPLFGEVVVFTGQQSMPRREIAHLATNAGCRVDGGVTKHTTLVVVGEQDVRVLNGADISAKHQKARDLVAKGQPIRVITESDLQMLLAH